jgi:hypothetical protein
MYHFISITVNSVYGLFVDHFSVWNYSVSGRVIVDYLGGFEANFHCETDVSLRFEGLGVLWKNPSI